MTRWKEPGELLDSTPNDVFDRQSAGTRAENENIAFDWAYVEYTSPIGLFSVGIQNDGAWGTVFFNSSVPHGLILYAIQVGGFTAFAEIVKITEQSKMAINSSTATDNDANNYQAGVVYEWKTGEAGLLGVYYHDKSGKANTGAVGRLYVLQPYAIVNLGPVKIQAEVDYAWGKIKYDDAVAPDIKVDNLAGWIDATADLNQFYLGATVAYVAGNEWTLGSQEKIKGGLLTGGMDWNPTLILFNNERTYWAGAIPGNWFSSTLNNDVAPQFGIDDTGMYNAWFFQARAGIRPVDKLDIMASVSYAKAVNTTWAGTSIGLPDFVSKEYGTEIDLVATYKITNNLSYMLGAGYLFTGDYFKGFDKTADVRDNLLVINKLTLTF